MATVDEHPKAVFNSMILTMRYERQQNFFILFCIGALFNLLKLGLHSFEDELQYEFLGHMLLNDTVLNNTNQEGLANAVRFRVTSSNNVSDYDESVVVSQKLCSRDQVKHGAWIPLTLEKPPYVSKNVHLRCYPLEDYQSGVWKTYDWKPHADCRLTEWSKSLFCDLLERVTILIIGDSLSWEHYSSLAQMLGLRVHQTSQHNSRLYRRNHVQLACKNKVRLVFRRDDQLRNVTDAIRNAFPQVVVMNRGAHYVNDTSLLKDLKKNFDEIRDWKERCDQSNIKCHFLWRTTVPGHPLCNTTKYAHPVNNLEEMEALIRDPSNYNNHTINYHWQDYQHQNELVLDMLKGTSGIADYDVLDAYYLNVLRPDEHRAHQNDCLHNCYPGKMDVYNRLLLHYLKMRRSTADVRDHVDRYNQAMMRSQEREVVAKEQPFRLVHDTNVNGTM